MMTLARKEGKKRDRFSFQANWRENQENRSEPNAAADPPSEVNLIALSPSAGGRAMAFEGLRLPDDDCGK
jgi:hypothetical protein